MKKKFFPILAAVFAVAIFAALLVNYKTDDLGKPAICVSIDENGNCTGTSTNFDADVEQVFFCVPAEKAIYRQCNYQLVQRQR